MKSAEVVNKNQDFDYEAAEGEFARDVLHGLSQTCKSLPCKYIYDDVGTELFSRIMSLPEYYPAGCEAEILETYGAVLAETIRENPVNLVELGAGDGQKTRILIGHLINSGNEFTYVPLDISGAAVRKCAKNLRSSFPDLRVRGMVSDYFDGLKWLASQDCGMNVALFLGSTIGNFSSRARAEFLNNLRGSLNPGDMVLVGFDLVKDAELMIRAYNDSLGVTAQFNKNILARINRELGGDFDLNAFRYFSTWDEVSGGIQSYLISKRPQKVRIEALSETFAFEPWEAIHTESSYKFSLPQIRKLAEDSGFETAGQYLDSGRYFADCLWKAV
ncbi:MAG: L-histidine N(alpha)-methyltransferase [Desulfobacteraceae bacterium]|nr:L-histidine N(alpha)-methyltransferase [Desulfobacteraceae bacterium]